MPKSLNQLSAEKATSLSALCFAGADLQKRIPAGRITDLWFETRATGQTDSGWKTAGPKLAINASDLSSLFAGNGATNPAVHGGSALTRPS